MLHFESAVDDLASNPTIRVSMGTYMPPPPTPPTLPKAAPRNPIILPTMILQPSFISCKAKSQMLESVNSNKLMHKKKFCQLTLVITVCIHR